MAWPVGVHSAERLKSVLAEFIASRLKAAPYRSQMPRRSYKVHAPRGSEKVAGSIKVLLYTGADEQPPHSYREGDKRVVEEWHRVTVDVQSDEKGARAGEDAQVADLLRQIFTSRTECKALIALGVYNVRETMEELNIDGVEFNRTMNLTCSTDRYISKE